jgi:hypothetical protein
MMDVKPSVSYYAARTGIHIIGGNDTSREGGEGKEMDQKDVCLLSLVGNDANDASLCFIWTTRFDEKDLINLLTPCTAKTYFEQ